MILFLRRVSLSAFTGADVFERVLTWADVVGAVSVCVGSAPDTLGHEWFVEVELPFRPSSSKWHRLTCVSDGSVNERLLQWRRANGEEIT